MSKKKFTEEFRQEAICQIIDRGRPWSPVVEVSTNLGVPASYWLMGCGDV